MRLIPATLAVVALIASLLVATPAQASTAPTTGSISGTVVDWWGDPMDFVWVKVVEWVELPRLPNGPLDSTMSDLEGGFTFDDLPPGDYALGFSPIARDDLQGGGYYPGQTAYEDAARLTVKAGETTTADMTLTIGLAAQAFVFDNGARVEGATATVVYDDGTEYVASTDAGGRALFGQLPLGTFTIRVDPPAGSPYPSQWHPGVESFEQAEWFSLEDGETATFLAFLAISPVASSEPWIEGDAVAGSTLTARPGDWAVGAQLWYEWLADGEPLPGEGGATLFLKTAYIGAAIALRVSGSLIAYEDVTRTSAPTPRVSLAGFPSIQGRAATGSMLTAIPGTWATGTSLRYQWFVDGLPIDGATASTYAPKAADDGGRVTVRVTGERPGWATAARLSPPSVQVMRVGAPKIVGTVVSGRTISVDPGTWTAGAALTYQWFANGVRITGATSPSLKLTTALRHARIAVQVGGRKSGYATSWKTTPTTARVPVATTPTLSGNAAVGQALRASVGTWTSGTTLTYQWLLDGEPVPGATSAAFRLPSTAEGKTASVRVTGSRAGYVTVSLVSSATARVMRASVPAISGSALVTRRLSAAVGTWTAGTSLTYQWSANGTPIAGATGSTFLLTAAHVGKLISVKVVGRLSGYTTVARTSASTAAVRYPLSTSPTSVWNCPSWAPIKGNRDSMIYHLPGQRYYSATQPEECFRTETAAVSAGYRRSKV